MRGVHIHTNLPGRRQPLQFNIFAQQALEHLEHTGHDLVEIDHFGQNRLFSGKGQQLSDQIRAPHRRLADFLQAIPHRTLRSAIIKQKFGVAENGLQHIVEIMRNPAGQPTNGFHFLGLKELFLQPFLLCFRLFSCRDICGKDQKVRFREFHTFYGSPPLFSVFRNKQKLTFSGAVFPQFAEHISTEFPITGIQQFLVTHREQFIGRISRTAAGFVIHLQVTHGFIQNKYAVRGIINVTAKPVIAFPQRFPRFPMCGHVLVNHDRAQQGMVVLQQRRHIV